MGRGGKRGGIRGFGLPIWTQYIAMVLAAGAYVSVSLAVTDQRASSMLALLAAISIFLVAYALRRPRNLRIANGRVTVVDAITKRELRSSLESDVTLVRSGSCHADVSDVRVYLSRSSWSRLADAVTTK